MKEQVPANAMHLQSTEISITEGASEDGEATLYEVSLLARSSQAIEHWYWGDQTIHDFAGMRVAEKIPIDFNHDNGEVIGYLDRFEQKPEGLVASGKLVSFSKKDRSAEIVRKAKAGIPWQASINFGGDGITVERITTEGEFTVNEKQFSGPATVIRTWPLRGVAITPYGADENTESVVLSNGNEILVDVLEESLMSDDQNTPEVENEEAVVAEAVEDQVEEVEQPEAAESSEEAEVVEEAAEAQLSAAEGKRFVELFGDQGALWFIEGKSEAECYALQIAQLKEDNASLAEEAGRLRELAHANAEGEANPVSFSEGVTPEDAERLALVEKYKKNGVNNDFVAGFAARFEKQLANK